MVAGRPDDGCCSPCGAIGNPFGGCVRITPKVTYTFQPQSSTTETHLLAKYVDTTMWVSGLLVVRVHARSFPSASQAIEVIVQNASYAEEDPALDFLDPTIRATATVNQGAPTAVPAVLAVAMTGAMGALVRVSVRGVQPGGVTSAFSATVGVDLVGRPC
jgi:hypothetical protein